MFLNYYFLFFYFEGAGLRFILLLYISSSYCYCILNISLLDCFKCNHIRVVWWWFFTDNNTTLGLFCIALGCDNMSVIFSLKIKYAGAELRQAHGGTQLFFRHIF